MPATVKNANNRIKVPKASGPYTTEPSPERDSENDNYLSTQSDLNEQKFQNSLFKPIITEESEKTSSF